MGFYVGNEEDGTTLAGLYPFFPAFRDFKKRIGITFECYAELAQGHMKWWAEEREYAAVAKNIFERILNDKTFFPLVKKKTVELSDGIVASSNEILRKNREGELRSASDAELVSLLKRQLDEIAEMLSWTMLITVIEIPHELVSRRLLEIVSEKAKEKKTTPAECAAVLSTPLEESHAKREFRELLEIACEIDANASAKTALLANKKNHAAAFAALEAAAPALAKKIRGHAEKFGWVFYGYGGPAWAPTQFAQEIIALLDEKNPARAKREMEERDEEVARKQREFEADLGLTDEEKRVIGIARDVMAQKAYRKEAMYYSYYTIERVQREFGRRAGLSLQQVRYLAPGEFEPALKTGAPDACRLDARFKHVVFGSRWKTGEIVVLDGAAADEQAKLFAEAKVAGLREVRGMCAQPGFAKGVVRIVNKPEDISKMRKGGVLVSIATTPDLVPAMRKAAAMVTDIGGLTCHAAIVSRELGIPCVVGTRVATKVFKDGDVVEVNATHGVVKKTG